jgi:CubicO group peptidase (beta-lactamase class C family)
MTSVTRQLILVLLFGLALPARAGDLATARPEKVGMSSERLARITALARRYVDEGKLAGVVTLVARHGKVVHYEAVGKQNLESGAPMTRDTLFRIYSMSKPITAVAAMILYEEGKFQLTDPVSKFVPELKGLKVSKDGAEVAPQSEINMQQLLSHTAGFSYGFSGSDPVDKRYQDEKVLSSKDLDEFIKRLAKIPLRYEPGNRWHYSVAVDVTGAVIERISGQRFDRFLRERVFAPLKMEDTFFEVPESKLSRFGTNHRWNAEQRKLEVLPSSDYPIYRNTTFFSGGGGLVSSAMDYMRFAEMLRNGGELEGVRVLSPKTIELMTMNHLPAMVKVGPSGEAPSLGGSGGSGFGLGFGIITDVPKSGVIGSVGEYSWSGAAGTLFWVDPVEDLVVVGMVQLLQSPWPLRRELKTLIYQALTELNGKNNGTTGKP